MSLQDLCSFDIPALPVVVGISSLVNENVFIISVCRVILYSHNLVGIRAYSVFSSYRNSKIQLLIYSSIVVFRSIPCLIMYSMDILDMA